MSELPPDPFSHDEVYKIISDEVSADLDQLTESYLRDESEAAKREIMAGESFAQWLAEKFPDLYGGENTLDPSSAYMLLKANEKNRG